MEDIINLKSRGGTKNYLKKMKKDGEITEDEQKDGEKKLQEITDSYTKQVDEMSKKKEAEILTI